MSNKATLEEKSLSRSINQALPIVRLANLAGLGSLGFLIGQQ